MNILKLLEFHNQVTRKGFRPALAAIIDFNSLNFNVHSDGRALARDLAPFLIVPVPDLFSLVILAVVSHRICLLLHLPSLGI